MDNKELKKFVPAELNEEELDMVTGGGQVSEMMGGRPMAAIGGLIIEEKSEDN